MNSVGQTAISNIGCVIFTLESLYEIHLKMQTHGRVLSAPWPVCHIAQTSSEAIAMRHKEQKDVKLVTDQTKRTPPGG